MLRIGKLSFAVALATVACLALLSPQLVAEDAGAPGELSFKAHNGMYRAEGSFKKWHFTEVNIPDGNLEQGTVAFEIDLVSVWEKAEKLAAHLRNADFFDVDKYATATVKIDQVKKTGDGAYEGVATVDLHGHTGEVPVTFEVVNESPLEIRGRATLNRVAFGIGQPYEEGNDRSIVEDVAISLSATLN